jgi:hypothetical protein
VVAQVDAVRPGVDNRKASCCGASVAVDSFVGREAETPARWTSDEAFAAGDPGQTNP